jgi:hypothetical protein
VASESTVELYADRSRRLPVNDPDDRELTMSCGAALFTIRVAAAHRGVDTTVTVLPDHNQPDLLARLQLEPDRPVDASLASLLEAVGRRRTVRGPFTASPVRDTLIKAMVAAADSERARLIAVGDAERDAVADLVAEGDRTQFADRRWRRELASWMRPRRSTSGLVVPACTAVATRLVLSNLDLGRRTATKDADLTRTAPALAVLATTDDEPAAWLDAGQALQRVLLTTTAIGFAVGYMNQPCQVGGRLRERLAATIEPGLFPQALLRVGCPGRNSRPPRRRPLTEVLRDSGNAKVVSPWRTRRNTSDG